MEFTGCTLGQGRRLTDNSLPRVLAVGVESRGVHVPARVEHRCAPAARPLQRLVQRQKKGHT